MAPEEHALVVDAGDFLGGDSEIDALKGEFLIRGFNLTGVAAVNLGEMDFLRGQAYLRHLERDLGAPFISANIVSPDNRKTFVEPYRIVRLGGRKILGWETGGLRVGIFGLISNEFPPRRARPEDEPLVVLDPWDAARRMVEELRPKCDMLIALSHLGAERSHELAASFPQIDVVVSGHGRVRMDGSRLIGSTIVVHSRSEGKYISDLALTLGAGHRVSSSQAVQLALNDEYPEDPELAALYDEYQAVLRERRAPRAEGSPLYAGAGTCARCHADQYGHWGGTAHAHALESLTARGEEHNPECLPCHTTGMGEPGGFYDVASTPGLAGVQCESCHGGALGHVQSRGEAAASEATEPAVDSQPEAPVPAGKCASCHDAVQDPDFDYETALAPIVH